MNFPRLLLWLALTSPLSAQDPLRAPGQRPTPATVHALVGARLVPKPGEELAKATLLIRDGRIEALGPDLPLPADARVHDLTGATIYAGFIDAHVTLSQSTESRATNSEETDHLTSGAGSGFLGAPVATATGSSTSVITPQRRLATELTPSSKLLEDLRAEGFTAANFVPASGVIRGSSAVAALTGDEAGRALLRADTFQHVLLDTTRGDSTSSRPRAYPGSLMGVITVIRQTFLDARFQAEDLSHFERHPHTRPRPAHNLALAALQPTLDRSQPVLFQPGGVLMVDRALRLAEELKLRPVLLASGQEWRRPDLLRGIRAPFVVPLDFPEAPKLPDEEDWQVTSLDLLRAWDHAPGNPALLSARGRQIALTTHGLGKKSAFHPNLRLAVARGLTAEAALAALTTTPAALCGLADQLGTLEPGKLAHLTILEKGRLTESTARVRAVWIDGRLFEPPPRDDKPASTTAAKTSPAKAAEPDKKAAAKEPNPREQLTASSARRGRGPLLSPKAVLIRNATIWTCGSKGKLENADLLIADGKITQVGKFKAELGPDTHVIDLPGIHVTPGLIDCHSHSMIMGGVNEGTLPSTAMVRVADVVNSETDTIAQQLAGGLTIANLLHGSANPIGGQNCVIKLRDGDPPAALQIPDAKPGIKFALGENVKQANWGDNFRNRFPQSRMGVPAFHTNRFTAAQQYLQALEKAAPEDPPVRRDLELETLGEILRGERLIHCHSYRQDEILAFLRVMESFGVRVGTLQHILEGYKVADEIANHGAGASAFSDWWAYKFEVFDAIPHAGSLMHDRGVLVSFNSDSSDHARRMNLEAAKAVKYGGTSEQEALKFVTLNPAIQLAIDHRVGSLEKGKDGDFVIWNGHPLATSSLCLQTWIEGRQYFERDTAHRRAKARERERLTLIEKAKKAAGSSTAASADPKATEKFFFRTLEDRQGHLCIDCCLDLEMPWKN